MIRMYVKIKIIIKIINKIHLLKMSNKKIYTQNSYSQIYNFWMNTLFCFEKWDVFESNNKTNQIETTWIADKKSKAYQKNTINSPSQIYIKSL